MKKGRVRLEEDLLKIVDQAVETGRYRDRQSFIREAIKERLKELGYPVPAEG